ncbi:MAG: CopG family ribbon-helix-helix protein [Candidatus Bipolaricaulaceae bacterium]
MPRAKTGGDKNTAKLSLYIPPTKGGAEVLTRLRRLARKRDRSVNYLVVEAILRYLEHEDKASV